MTFYRIRNWSDHFENNRTKDLKRMAWLPVPNKHDGDGFTELLDHPEGMSHYGAWHLILQVASKCDPRGTLLREGAEGVKIPHTPQSLARITHGSAGVFEACIPRLLSIGWLETYENPAPSCGTTAPSCAEVPMERNGMEGNGTERKNTNTPPTPSQENVCVNLPLKKDELHSNNRFKWLEGELCSMYKRPRPNFSRGEEEHLVSEVSRRPDVQSELKELKKFREEIGERYFPQSLKVLCQEWDKMLDRARNHAPAPKSFQEKSIVEKDLDKFCRQIMRET